MNRQKMLNSYIAFLSLAAVIILALNINAIVYEGIEFGKLAVFFAVLVISESLILELKNGTAVSFSLASQIVALYAMGIPNAVLTVGLSEFFSIYYKKGKSKTLFNRPFKVTMFNTASTVISFYMSSYVSLHYTGNILMAYGVYGYMNQLISIMSFTITYLVVNDLLICLIMGLDKKDVGFMKIFYENLIWGLPNFFSMGFMGFLLNIAFNMYGYISLVFFFIPVVIVRYTVGLYLDLKKTYYETIQAFVTAIEAKDEYTKGHSQRVEKYAEAVAKELGFSDDKIEKIKMAALLHDVGKIGVDEEILNKPGKLTMEEFDKVKKHPEIGYKIVKNIEFLDMVAEWIRYHHEWYDGKGYPDGINDDNIPLEAGILAIADVYDALTSARSYRNAMNEDEAYSVILNEKGHFIPAVLEAFKRAFTNNRELFTRVY